MNGYEIDLSTDIMKNCSFNYNQSGQEWECPAKCHKMNPACSAWSFNSPGCTISTCKVVRLKFANNKVVKLRSMTLLVVTLLTYILSSCAFFI